MHAPIKSEASATAHSSSLSAEDAVQSKNHNDGTTQDDQVQTSKREKTEFNEQTNYVSPGKIITVRLPPARAQSPVVETRASCCICIS